MLTLIEEQKEREIELERLLTDCDRMLETDCHPSGQPLVDEEYKQLWRDIRKYEDELRKIRRSESQLPEEKEHKKETTTHIFFDNDGSMDCDLFKHKKSKNDGLEL